ncbi:hypothetical protein [Nocardia sp. NPDC051463]|uniref:hypothetical protein n=1 Tax=Nocardia sp. NPDC051463 TaxID=3154845 RepID=UPI00344CCAA6
MENAAVYVEEFVAVGAMTADTAEDLAAVAGRYTTRITVSSNGHTVQALVLPYCWTDLRIVAGSTISVTADSGYRPPDSEDRRAIRDFVSRFRSPTSNTAQR